MLIQYGENRIVNLTNVSNIFVEEAKKKVIFNMNYSVKIFGGKTEEIEVIEAQELEEILEEAIRTGKVPQFYTKTVKNIVQEAKLTPDYTYWDYETEEEKKEIVDLIESKLRESSWIFPENPTLRYVNLDCVSSISFDDRNNRIIFNLNYHVSHPKDDTKLTSDYVFWNFGDDSDKYALVAGSFESLANRI